MTQHSAEFYLKKLSKSTDANEAQDLICKLQTAPTLRDKHKEYSRKFAHIYKTNGKYRSYYQQNKDSLKERSRKCYTGRTSEANVRRIKSQVPKTYCRSCYTTQNLRICRILPLRYAESSDTLDNFICLCNSCHQHFLSLIECNDTAEDVRLKMKLFTKEIYTNDI